MRYFYLRTATGTPVACIASEVATHDQESGEPSSIRFALSVCNPVDPFNRTLARAIAQGRMSAGQAIIIANRPFKADFLKLLAKDDICTADLLGIKMGVFPKRVRAAAQAWLTRITNAPASFHRSSPPHIVSEPEPNTFYEDRAEQPINFDSGISANLTPAIHSAREVEIEIHVDSTSQSALDRIFSYPGPHRTETGWQWRDQPCVRPNPLANYHGPNLDDLRLERAGVPSPTEPAFIDDDDPVDADIDWSVD